ncbi:hypothetical protein DPMN_122168 [Dreissena polymorpha]|uniref:Uncharacterized protein n=1 Tax=Dreissena polymorpha TaxID=45954 RepID=A0A9D4GP58_DREPO|nr:hypothetical protein DPMN_122168 [Dreissena polymorpha]
MWRLSATASGESVAEGTLTGPYLAPLPHNRSLKSRLSLGVGDPERRNLADLFGPIGPIGPNKSAKFRRSGSPTPRGVI